MNRQKHINKIVLILIAFAIVISSVTIATIGKTSKASKYKISDQSDLAKMSITVTIPKEMTIYLGNTEKITMKSSEESAQIVSYRSSNENIARVVDGVVIGERKGTASIVSTVLINNKYYEYKTQVTVKPGKVTVTADKETIEVGETTRIKTIVSKGVWNSLSYSSNNPKVATVVRDDAYGFVEGVSEGVATITVKLDIGSQATTKTVKIKVVKPGKKKLPVSNPVNAKNFTVDDDWQGSRVFFGEYEQDNNPKNGREPILWRVLQVKDDTLLLLSEYGLICKNYHEVFENVTWETSTLRAWLNSDFLDTAFTNKERDAINDTVVSTKDSKKYKTSGGNDTVDKVYLLSYEEVQNNAYGFQSGVNKKSKSRQLKLTPSALVEGYAREDNGNTCWWLRSPGITNQYAAYVFTTGALTESYFVGRRNDAVRPVIQVKLSSITFGDYISDGKNKYIQIIAN